MYRNFRLSVNRVGTLARVLLLVGIPLVLLTATTVNGVVGSANVAQHARALASRVVVLDDLVDLRRALFAERTQVEVSAWAESIGLETSGTALGINLESDVQSLRDDTESAMALLSPEARPFDQSDLVRIRQATDAGALTPSVLAGRFDALDLALTKMLAGRLADVKAGAFETGDLELDVSVTTLEDSIQAFDLSSVLVNELGALWYAEPFEASLAQSHLATTYSSFQAACDRVQETADKTVVAAWINATSGSGQFTGAIDDALKGIASPVRVKDSLTDPMKILGDGFHMASLASTVPSVASSRVRDLSGMLVSTAKTDMIHAGMLAGVSVLGSLLAAFFIGRSVIVPIQRLTRQAEAVGAGDLCSEPLPEVGPPELVLASKAFNELSSNLELLDRKARALAECDFDSAALQAPLPGQLGRSLARSVQVLSGSIVERERLQLKLAHQATHDTLTGIPNRAAALQTLTAATARANRSSRLLGVVFVDLDDFKRINDTFGHPVGDEVLRKVSKRLATIVRGGDFVGRLGGDEFVVIAEDLAGEGAALALVNRLLSTFNKPLPLKGLTLSVGASAGVALSSGGQEKPLELLRKADFALYRAKQDDELRSSIYDDALEKELLNKADIEKNLEATLARGGDELRLRYQPIVNSASGRLMAVEALICWARPGHGVLPPDSFIPIAEQTDLIIEIDQWVMKEAARQLADWSARPGGLTDIAISINISGRHVLNAGFIGHVEETLAMTRLDPRRISLEITETVLVSDLDRAASQLEAVRKLGVRVSIDDFGTGYSSIAHLRSLPIDEIKIDRSLTAGFAEAGNHSLCKLVGDIAQHLGVRTVAEGVENETQLAILSDLGCTALQGFYFSRPLSPDALVAWEEGKIDIR